MKENLVILKIGWLEHDARAIRELPDRHAGSGGFLFINNLSRLWPSGKKGSVGGLIIISCECSPFTMLRIPIN